ncbi:MAG: hypothetical protein IT317_09615 [Anaerolineales bacterium]|nr:hypothetical protein [Anaerolineales bacterium]
MGSTTGYTDEPWRETVAAVYQTKSRGIFAALIRLLGDFVLAEEAQQNAMAGAWLVSAGRFRAIADLHQRARFDGWLAVFA